MVTHVLTFFLYPLEKKKKKKVKTEVKEEPEIKHEVSDSSQPDQDDDECQEDSGNEEKTPSNHDDSQCKYLSSACKNTWQKLMTCDLHLKIYLNPIDPILKVCNHKIKLQCQH